MAVSLSGMSLHTNNDNESGWGGTDGPDDYNNAIQGTNSESWQVSKNATETGTLTKSSALNATRGIFTFWMSSNLAPYYTDIDLELQSTTNNYKTFTVATSTNKAIGGNFVASAVDYVNNGVSTGTFAPASFSALRLILDNSASGNIRSVINNWIDAMYYGPGHTVSGTTTGDLLFKEAAAVDELPANKYGVMWNYNGIIYCQGDLDLAGTDLTSDSETLVFVDTLNGYGTYQFDVTGTLALKNTGVIGAGTIDYNLDASGATSFSMTGGFLTNNKGLTLVDGQTFDGVVINSNATSSIANDPSGCTWNTSGLITVTSTGSLTASTLNKGSGPVAVDVATLDQLDLCHFVSDGTGHAVDLGTISVTDSMIWDNTESGYASSDGSTGNETILVSVNSGITLTINVSATGSTPTIKNDGTGTVYVVVGQVTLTLIGLPDGIEVRFRQGSHTIQHTQNVTGGQVSYTYAYAANTRMTISFSGAGIIQSKTLDITLPSANQTSLVTFVNDPSYQGGIPVFSGTIADMTATQDVAMDEYDTSTHFTNNPTSYGLTGEPIGMSINSEGVISGVMTTIAETTGIYVTATNSEGNGVSNSLAMNVISPFSWVGNWQLETGSGLVAYDSSINLHNGVIGADAVWATANNREILDFDGTALSRVIIPHDADFDLTGDITLAAWVSPSTTATRYLVKKTDSDENDGYEISLSSSGTVFVRFNAFTSGNTYRANSTFLYPIDNIMWIHVVATFDGTNIKLYINGQLDVTLPASALTIGTNTEDLILCAEPSTLNYYEGYMDNAQILDSALTDAEVLRLAGGADFSELTNTALTQVNSSTVEVGEKPQSKVWKFDGKWWMVMPDDAGKSYAWRLDTTTWVKVLLISDTFLDAKADTIIDSNDIVHVLLVKDDGSARLASLEHTSGSPNTYALWTTITSLTLGSAPETATLTVDSTGRMWVAYTSAGTVKTQYSDSPYSSFSAAADLATGLDADDLCTIVKLSSSSIAVMWSNQSATERFGFRVHDDSDGVTTWATDEVPASQSALAVGAGMADDHINLAVTSDGILFAAVKTNFDTTAYTALAMLKRHADGTWDDMYGVSMTGTRPIVQINDEYGYVVVIYSEDVTGGDIVYRQAAITDTKLGGVHTLKSGEFTDVSSSKANFDTDLVVIISDDADSPDYLISGALFS